MNLMGFCCGRTLQVVQGSVLEIFGMRWGGDFGFVFGMTCGVGSYLLKKAFSLLYRIARNKDPFVAEHLCWQNGIVVWGATS